MACRARSLDKRTEHDATHAARLVRLHAPFCLSTRTLLMWLLPLLIDIPLPSRSGVISPLPIWNKDLMACLSTLVKTIDFGKKLSNIDDFHLDSTRNHVRKRTRYATYSPAQISVYQPPTFRPTYSILKRYKTLEIIELHKADEKKKASLIINIFRLPIRKWGFLDLPDSTDDKQSPSSRGAKAIFLPLFVPYRHFGSNFIPENPCKRRRSSGARLLSSKMGTHQYTLLHATRDLPCVSIARIRGKP